MKAEAVTAWVGLGGNMADTRGAFTAAVDMLERDPRVGVLAKSSLYRTAPWGETDQTEFINAVARIACRMAAAGLLEMLLGIERELGRQRNGRRWGPRVIDLDLLLYADAVMSGPTLELPHPRMHERAFVLAPLAELSPGIVIPGHGVVEDLLDRVRDQHVERLDSLCW